MLEFDELREDEKEQNRGAVRDIPVKLAAFGYLVTPIRSSTRRVEQLPPEIVEQLAEREHERWARMKLDSEWVYGTTTEKVSLIHKALLPWSKFEEDELTVRYGVLAASRMGKDALPEEEKARDREQVRDIPEMLGRAGYMIVPMASGPAAR